MLQIRKYKRGKPAGQDSCPALELRHDSYVTVGIENHTMSKLTTVDFFIMHTSGSLSNPMHYENYALWDMHLSGGRQDCSSPKPMHYENYALWCYALWENQLYPLPTTTVNTPLTSIMESKLKKEKDKTTALPLAPIPNSASMDSEMEGPAPEGIPNTMD